MTPFKDSPTSISPKLLRSWPKSSTTGESSISANGSLLISSLNKSPSSSVPQINLRASISFCEKDVLHPLGLLLYDITVISVSQIGFVGSSLGWESPNECPISCIIVFWS